MRNYLNGSRQLLSLMLLFGLLSSLTSSDATAQCYSYGYRPARSYAYNPYGYGSYGSYGYRSGSAYGHRRVTTFYYPSYWGTRAPCSCYQCNPTPRLYDYAKVVPPSPLDNRRRGSALGSNQARLPANNEATRNLPAPTPTPPAASGTAALADLITTARKAGNFKTLLQAAQEANVLDEVEQDLTVFAPSDAAFQKLPPAFLAQLLGNKELLKKLLLYHALPQELKLTNQDSLKLTSVEGGQLSIERLGDIFYVNGVEIKTPGTECSNGIMYEIQEVLLPPGIDVPAGNNN